MRGQREFGMGVLARLTAVIVAVTLGVAGCATHTETEGTVLTVGMLSLIHI